MPEYYHSEKPCKLGHTLRTKGTRGCTVCRRALHRRWAAANIDSEARRIRQRVAHQKRPILGLLSNARMRAKKFGIPYNVTSDDCIIPTVCPILGIPLQTASGQPTDNSPSLDRRDPAKGYVKGNVAVISFRANMIKNAGTAAELRAIADWMDLQGLLGL